MGDYLLEEFLNFFHQYGYWAVFFGLLIENAGIPFPGETILLISSFLSYSGPLRLHRVIIAGTAAAFFGDTTGYVLGRRFGRPLLERQKRVAFLRKRIEQTERFFARYGTWTVFIARFLPGARIFGGPLAGVSRMRLGPFLVFDFAGALIWTVTISSIGYLFGSQWDRMLRIVSNVKIGIGVAVVLVIVVVYWRQRRLRLARLSGEESGKGLP